MSTQDSRPSIDKLFQEPISKQFEFDDHVALVFDDMLNRSIPYYKEAMELGIFYLTNLLHPGDRIIDLGCSTGNTLIALAKTGGKSFDLMGIDSSRAMIHKAREKAKAYGVQATFDESDFLSGKLPKAQAYIASYTLQFVRPRERERLIREIAEQLDENGLFLFSEKIVSTDPRINKLMIEKYYEYKRAKGYSDFEISQKREALENVLVPYSEEENRQMVLANGFASCEGIFRWNNFATFLARK